MKRITALGCLLAGLLVAPVAAFWVAALRVVLFMVLYQLGLMPRAPAAG